MGKENAKGNVKQGVDQPHQRPASQITMGAANTATFFSHEARKYVVPSTAMQPLLLKINRVCGVTGRRIRTLSNFEKFQASHSKRLETTCFSCDSNRPADGLRVAWFP